MIIDYKIIYKKIIKNNKKIKKVIFRKFPESGGSRLGVGLWTD